MEARIIRGDIKSKQLQVLVLSLSILLIGGCDSSAIHLFKPKILPRPIATEQEKQRSLLPQKTKMDELDLSGCSISDAEEKVRQWSKDKLEETRVLMYNNIEMSISLEEIGIDLDYQKTMEDIARNPGRTTSSSLKFDMLKLNESFQEQLKKFNQPSRNASYKVEGDKFIIIPAENGLTVDFNKIIGDILKCPLSKVAKRIVVPMTETPAAVTTEAIKSLSFDTVIGEYTTKFPVEEKNRSANLMAAAKALDRKIIRPGEIFSFNNTVGPREAETGYKNAYIIINGKYVRGIGGGVCQVSSTLYNAVLLSNLKVVERMPHAVAVNYVAAGQDATVNYPNIDFKFENNMANLLYLRSNVQNGTLIIQIWGKKPDKSVRIERQIEKVIKFKTIKKFDANLAAGRVRQVQKGTQGFIVNTWRVVKDNRTGKETKVFLNKDSYAPMDRILRVGA